MMADKLIGPRVKIVLSKFLPSIFMDAMRDSSDASVHMFEGSYLVLYMIQGGRRKPKASSLIRYT